MKRDNGYYRRMRIKHIQRKKRIAQFCYGEDYSCIVGKYAKGKVHCSCPMCRGKDYYNRHIETVQEKKSKDRMKEQMKNI